MMSGNIINMINRKMFKVYDYITVIKNLKIYVLLMFVIINKVMKIKFSKSLLYWRFQWDLLSCKEFDIIYGHETEKKT